MTIQRRTILFLGDGNFSFSLSFIKLLIHSQTDKCPSLQYIEYHNDDDITFEYVCTSFDSYDEVVEKYPESRKILDTLSDLPNVTVMHGINAWELRKHFPNTKFDYIIWNHPHLGTENYRLHRKPQ